MQVASGIVVAHECVVHRPLVAAAHLEPFIGTPAEAVARARQAGT